MKDTKHTEPKEVSNKLPPVPWNGWLGVLFVIVLFYAAQVVGSVLVATYAGLHHWTGAYAQVWLTNSIAGQFVYIVAAEGLTLGGLYVFMRRYGFGFKKLGLRRLHWRDAGYALLAIPVYYALAVVALAMVKAFAPGINLSESQQVGFDAAQGAGAMALLMTFISLAILPPLTEEIMVRGFLYSSLKKSVPQVTAVIVTCIIFAAAHLGEGSAGLLWTAAVQFFVLSLVLVWLREKTQSLWAPIFLHAVNNTVAFVSLFLIR